MCTAERQRRRQSQADIYHVYARGSGRQLIYESDDDCQTFLGFLSKAADATETDIFAYALMGNHYHLVVRSAYDQLPKFAHALNRAYATYFNDEHGRTGHLFQSRYNSEPIDDESYFLAAIRYVHRNPVEAGLAPTCEYPWSSYPAYLNLNPRNQVTPVHVSTELALDLLDGTDSFVSFHSHSGKESFVDDAPAAPRMTSAELLAAARSILGDEEPAGLKALPKSKRDAALKRLRSGLTIPQICLVTGLSRSTVKRAS